jgi:AmiR/NasT family two-component response regulator
MNDRTCQPLRPSMAADHGDREETQRIIYTAVELLQSEHQVRDTSAYMVLVMASVDAGLSVRETARQIIEDPTSDRWRRSIKPEVTFDL